MVKTGSNFMVKYLFFMVKTLIFVVKTDFLMFRPTNFIVRSRNILVAKILGQSPLHSNAKISCSTLFHSNFVLNSVPFQQYFMVSHDFMVSDSLNLPAPEVNHAFLLRGVKDWVHMKTAKMMQDFNWLCNLDVNHKLFLIFIIKVVYLCTLHNKIISPAHFVVYVLWRPTPTWFSNINA